LQVKARKCKQKSFYFLLFPLLNRAFSKGCAGKNKKIALRPSSRAELWAGAQTAMSFAMPTGFLIADYHTVPFCFMQENVRERTEARQPGARVASAPIQAQFRRQFNRISSR
jgi:hypothetical protein